MNTLTKRKVVPSASPPGCNLIQKVKEQADHSSLEMTGIYMGDSGGKAHEIIKTLDTF